MNEEILKLIPFLHSPQSDANASLTEEQRFLLVLLRRTLQKTDRQPFSIETEKLHHQDAEELFYKIVIDDFNKREARLFIVQMFFQKDFYQTIKPLLEIIAQARNSVPPAGFPMLSDDVILRKISAKCTAQKRTPFSVFLQHLRQRLQVSRYIPRLTAAAVVISAFVFFARELFKTNELYTDIFIDAAEPVSMLSSETYSYHSGLRGPSFESLPKWRDTYRQAMADYLTKDYEKAVDLFSELLPMIESDPTLSATLQKEFYFHFGMAYLGKSGGRSFQRRNYIRAAQLLEKALMYNPNENEAETIRFFLGLSLHLKGDKAAAAYFK